MIADQAASVRVAMVMRLFSFSLREKVALRAG
jgi:hypothetical protein